MAKAIGNRVTYTTCGITWFEKVVKPVYERAETSDDHATSKTTSDLFNNSHSESDNDNAVLDSEKPLPAMPIIVAILIVGIGIAAYCTIQYIAITNCPDQFYLDNAKNSLQQCEMRLDDTERAKNATQKKNEQIDAEITKIARERDENKRNLKNAETQLKSLENELDLAKQREEKLKEDMAKLNSAKDTIDADLKATRYNLGNCKNKNMDHEVQSLELLQEIEGLKKELKAC